MEPATSNEPYEQLNITDPNFRMIGEIAGRISSLLERPGVQGDPEAVSIFDGLVGAVYAMAFAKSEGFIDRMKEPSIFTVCRPFRVYPVPAKWSAPNAVVAMTHAATAAEIKIGLSILGLVEPTNMTGIPIWVSRRHKLYTNATLRRWSEWIRMAPAGREPAPGDGFFWPSRKN